MREMSTNLKTSFPSTNRPYNETPSDEKKSQWKMNNRKTLEKLQTAAKVSPEKMGTLETLIGNVDECDNQRLRKVIPEWITTNVPHNKQAKVRKEIHDTLYALVPASTQSRMEGQEKSYRSGSMEPPGSKHTCPSDSESDDERHEADEHQKSAPQAGSDIGKNDHDARNKNDKQPPSKKRKTSDTSSHDAGPHRFDVSNIHLEGEENDAVPVYETCDMVRRKIDKHLKEPGVTQASFCRDLHSQFHSDTAPKQLNSKYLNNFRGQKGYDKGSTSTAFYAAYCFFEKLRIKEGKPKSKDRLKMEELWSEKGGFDIKRQSHNKGIWKCRGEGLKKNMYGVWTITKPDGRELSVVM